jgi:DNA-binding NtrC family response regulator
VMPLVRHFARPGLVFDEGAEAALAGAPWPGNVRELQNAVQRLGILGEGDVVTAAAVRRWVTGSDDRAERTVVIPAIDPFGALVGRSLADVEHELVRRTLAHCGGNRTRTAELLGIGVRTLFNRLQTMQDDTMTDSLARRA